MIGVDYRVCQKWLRIVNDIAKDLAIWEKADINYNGRRHDDENEVDASDDDADDDQEQEVESEFGEAEDQKSD